MLGVEKTEADYLQIGWETPSNDMGSSAGRHGFKIGAI
jgi:hypothetical protein